MPPSATTASRLGTAIERARDHLLEQADRNFEETAHEMVFPRRAGFRVKRERQRSDGFARAVLGGVWLDVAELVEDRTASVWVDIARREADHAAAAKLGDRAGGWSYFPQLPELPPDLDSLAAVTTLFSRTARQHLPLCEEPVRLALEARASDGSLSTWIVSSNDDPARRRLMQRAVERHWGDGVDVEVCARFYGALHRMDPGRFAAAVRQGVDVVAGRQQPSGTWDATWYWGEVYGTGLCMRLLREVEGKEAVVSRAVKGLHRLQRVDGGWGTWESVPLDTALALWALAHGNGTGDRDRIRRGLGVLFEHQNDRGSWPATPWIKMDVGRAGGAVQRRLTYQSTTLTTAFCLRALLLARRVTEG